MAYFKAEVFGAENQWPYNGYFSCIQAVVSNVHSSCIRGPLHRQVQNCLFRLQRH